MKWTATVPKNRPGLALAAALIAAIAWTVPARAAEAPPRPAAQDPAARSVQAPTLAAAVRMSVADAIARGLETSHRLAQLRGREAAAQATVSGQEAERRPQAQAHAGYQRTAHVTAYELVFPGRPPQVIYPDVPDNFSTRVDFSWPVFTSGRLEAQVRAAKAESDATGKDLAAARIDLKLEVTRAFWALVTAREAERVVAQALENIDAHLADVRNRQTAGLVPPNDVLSTEAQRSRQQVLLINARHAVESASAELGRLTGLDPDTPIEPDASLDQPPASPQTAAQALVDEARNARADRQAIQLRISSFTARGDAARAGKWPVIGVAGGLDYARPNPRIFPREAAWQSFWDVGVNVTWTFWDGGRVAASVAQAVANRSIFQEQLNEFDSVLEVEVRQRLRDLDSANAAVRAAADGIRSAAEARRVVEERFKAGVAINTEVLDAQQALLVAELDRTRALADARLAEAQLERALGR